MNELEFYKDWIKKIYKDEGFEQFDIILNPSDKIFDTTLSNRLKKILLKHNIVTIQDVENDIFQIRKGMGMVISKEYNLFRYQYKLGKFFN